MTLTLMRETAGGGFFRGNEIAPGVVGLTPSQHLLIFAAVLTFDGHIQRGK
jgi:hypothetical protein